MNATLRIRTTDPYETKPVRSRTERPATLLFASPTQRIEQLPAAVDRRHRAVPKLPRERRPGREPADPGEPAIDPGQ